MPYQEEFFETNIVKLRRMFPLLHLWRIPGIAFEWRKLLVCCIAVFITGLINDLFGCIESCEQHPGCHFFPSEWYYGNILSMLTWNYLRPLFETFDLRHFQIIYSTHFLLFIFNLCLWTFAGLVTVNLAAHDFAQGKAASFRSSFSVAIKQFMVIVYLSLFAGVLIVGLNWLIGLLPYLSQFHLMQHRLFGVITIGYLLIGFMMYWFCFIFVIGLPYQISATIIDRADHFDSISRIHSYCINRHGYFLLMLTLNFVLCLAMLFVLLHVLHIVVLLVNILVVSEYSTDFMRKIYGGSGYKDSLQGISGLPCVMNIFGFKEVVYMEMYLNLIFRGAAASLFWTSSTVIYFLLRNAEDGTPLNEIYQPKVQTAETGVPLVGIAERERAMKQAVAATPPIKEEPLADTPL